MDARSFPVTPLVAGLRMQPRQPRPLGSATFVCGVQAMEQQEEWRAIPGFPDYEASNLGRVRSWRGRVRRRPSPKVLRLIPHSAGYLHVALWREKRESLPGQLVHRLVLMAFIGLPPDGHECRHLNGDRTDNRLSNLMWGTHDENMGDNITNRTVPTGDRHWNHKLTDDIAREILSTQGRITSKEWATRLGVSHSVITAVRRRETWRHVGGE